MDTITHAVAGAAIAMAVKDRVGKAGVAAVMAATLAPDADLVVQVFSPELYLKYHRVVLNSLPVALALSTVIAAAAWLYGRYKNFAALWGLSSGAMMLHVAMDYTNSYGAKPLWPFVNKWSALDLVFIIDPWVTGIFALGILAMKYYGKKTLVLAACLALLFSYWGMREFAHQRAMALFKLQYPDAISIGAFPAPVNPFKWRMVAQTCDAYWTGWYNIVDGEWDAVEIHPRPKPEKVIMAAREAPFVKTFLEFARYPWFSYLPNDDSWTVSIQDLRFSGFGGGRGFVTTVKVNPDGTTDGGKFSFRKND